MENSENLKLFSDAKREKNLINFRIKRKNLISLLTYYWYVTHNIHNSIQLLL